MRDPSRISRMLEKVEAIWINNPDLRLGQLLTNAAPAGWGNDLFYLEDEDLEAEFDNIIDKYINERSEK